MKESILKEAIDQKIYFIRGQRVMLDKDLAILYGVQTKSLNLAVKRNYLRFPRDFMFRLNKKEAACLRFQFETSKKVVAELVIFHMFLPNWALRCSQVF